MGNRGQIVGTVWAREKAQTDQRAGGWVRLLWLWQSRPGLEAELVVKVAGAETIHYRLTDPRRG